jgi:hypothetical protein
MELSLSPKQYHYRLPFFARITGENEVRIDGYTQAIMDQEIAYAKAGRLDYWAFLLYDRDSAMSQGLSLYLSSAHKQDMHFCAIASPPTFGGTEKFAQGVDRIVKLMAEPSYQKVMGDRPLLYLFDVSDRWLDAWGGPERAKTLFTALHSAVQAAGHGDPYVVVADFSPTHGRKIADIVGAQALTSYTKGGSGRGAPYAELARGAYDFWNACADMGLQVVPIVVAGWDRRPRVEHPVPWESYQKPGVGLDQYYVMPTPKELAGSIRYAAEWISQHKLECPACVELIYAWNEHDEGGYLCPTLNPDGSANTDRLDAIAAMVKDLK